VTNQSLAEVFIGGLSEKIKTKSLNLKRNTGLVSYRGRPTGTAGYTVGIIHTKNKKNKPKNQTGV